MKILLTVVAPPPDLCGRFPAAVLITSMLKDLNAQERDTITFEVTVNHEGITYKWLKNGVEVKSSDRCQVRSRQLTHTLTIRNVHFGDGGEYQFVAGSAATSANLFVEGKSDVCVTETITLKDAPSEVCVIFK